MNLLLVRAGAQLTDQAHWDDLDVTAVTAQESRKESQAFTNSVLADARDVGEAQGVIAIVTGADSKYHARDSSNALDAYDLAQNRYPDNA